MAYKAIGPDKKARDIQLTARLSSGGEGYVYDTNWTDVVAKVYKKGHATENKYRKCNWFVEKDFHRDGICLPTHILADDDDNFRNINQLRQHSQFAVGLETREHAARMVIVEQLAAQLQVQLAAELVDPLDNPLRLDLRILIVIKTDFHLPPPA